LKVGFHWGEGSELHGNVCASGVFRFAPNFTYSNEIHAMN
jgi:hypothetical protein